MKYTEIKSGRNKGFWENEDGVIYTEKVARKRMANPELYDPEPVKKAPAKKKAKK